MKSSSCLIFLLSITFATSQILNLKMTDNILGQSNTRLRSSESRLASAMFSFAETVRNSSRPAVSSSKKVQATVSRLDLSLAELAELIDSLQTISSQEVFPNLSTSCIDINTKIIYIETNLRKYSTLGVQARVNMSMLQISIANVVTYAKIEKSTLNVTSIVDQGKNVIANFQNYLAQLTNSIKAETTVRANYENYRRGNCICSAESSMSASTQLTGFIKMILDVDTTLRTNQANIKTAITAALPKITGNINEIINFNLQQLQGHFRRVSTCSDHPVDNITVTSCAELLAVVGRAQFRGWLTMQVGIVERNLTMSSKYLANLRQTLSASTTLTDAQKTALTSTVEAVTAAVSSLTKYSTDLKSFGQRLASVSTELKTLADNFCLCKPSETTTALRTVTTLPPPATNSQCRLSGQVLDISGAVLKQVCFVKGGHTIESADEKCRSLNMSLYSISDDADARALLAISYKASVEMFGAIRNTLVYKINGKQRADGSWYYFNPNTTALPREAIPKNATGSNRCLTVNGLDNTTFFASTGCEALNWPLCEFGKVTPPTNVAPSTKATSIAPKVDANTCGTLLPFNATSSMNGPDTLGFASGRYYDNSTIYPGTSELGGRKCAQQYPGPSRIQMGRSLKGPGGYFPCGNVEWYDATTAKFFAKHPSLTWVRASQANLSSIPGIINVQSPFAIMQVGRINLKYPNGTFQQIGKIYKGSIYFINTTGSEQAMAGPYDVLTCTPSV